MAISLINFGPTEIELENVGKRSSKGVREALEDGAYQIKEAIEQYTPYKYGALEVSWRVEKNAGVGKRGRNTFNINFVDRLTFDPHAKTTVYVSDYIHEVHDMSWDRRGDGTKAKGSQAGPKFVDRALQDNEGYIDDIVEREIDKVLNRF